MAEKTTRSKKAPGKPVAPAPERPKRKLVRHPFWEQSLTGSRVRAALQRTVPAASPAELAGFFGEFERAYGALSKRRRAPWNDPSQLRERLRQLEAESRWETASATVEARPPTHPYPVFEEGAVQGENELVLPATDPPDSSVS